MVTYRATDSGIKYKRSTAGGDDITIDDASVLPLALSSLIAVTNVGSADVLAEAKIVVVSGTQCGLALRINSQSAPTDGIFVYHNGSNVVVDKLVSGVWTNLASTAATYVASAVLRVITSGPSVDVYYNSAKVGSTLTVSDATVLNNSLQGVFSTHASNTCDDFVAWPRTSAQYEILNTL